MHAHGCDSRLHTNYYGEARLIRGPIQSRNSREWSRISSSLFFVVVVSDRLYLSALRRHKQKTNTWSLKNKKALFLTPHKSVAVCGLSLCITYDHKYVIRKLRTEAQSSREPNNPKIPICPFLRRVVSDTSSHAHASLV